LIGDTSAGDVSTSVEKKKTVDLNEILEKTGCSEESVVDKNLDAP